MMDIIADILNDHQCGADTLRRDHDQHPKPRHNRCNICDNINQLVPLIVAAIENSNTMAIFGMVDAATAKRIITATRGR